MLFEALVTEVLPKVAGIRVRFRDLVPSGFGANDYVRVLCRRMSPQGGADLELPEVGEHGVVGQMNGGTCVWLGASPFLNKNQVDPTPGISYHRHRSGVVSQVRDTGEFEIAHPSGLRITASIGGGPLPALQATSAPMNTVGQVPTLNISSPAGASVSIDPAGNVVVTTGGTLTINGGTIALDAATLLSLLSAAGITITGAAIALDGAVTLNGVPLVMPDVPEPSDLMPLQDATPGAIGVSNKWARADHVHPLGTGDGGPGH